MTDTTEQLKARFLRVYGRLPIHERDAVILKIDDGPLTWRVVYFEVTADSENVPYILKQLADLEFI